MQRVRFSVALEAFGLANKAEKSNEPRRLLVNQTTSNEDLRALLRLEFELDDDLAMSLVFEAPDDWVIVPVQTDLLDNDQHYLLRTYPQIEPRTIIAEEPEDIWETYNTAEGKEYYYNPKTKQTSWTKQIDTDDEQDLTEQEYYEQQGFDPWEDEQYFNSYSNLKLQESMVKDLPRSDAYLKAILSHPTDFKDAIVLDVGCGTGLLSFFAARAGARKVYAVEGSELATLTQKVVEDNNMQDKIIVLNGKMEDLQLPEKVDIIVSEWMGSVLIFESMLDSVIFARDNWLREGGLLYPSRAKMYLTPIQYDSLWEGKITYWSNVYDINMSAFASHAKDCHFKQSIFDTTMPPECVLAKSSEIADLDLMTITADDLNVLGCSFSFTVGKQVHLHGFAAWFDVTFESHSSRKGDNTKEQPVILSTDPAAPATHWKQEIFIMDEVATLQPGERINGSFEIARNTYWKRHFNIDISFHVNDDVAKTVHKSFPRWREKSKRSSSPNETKTE